MSLRVTMDELMDTIFSNHDEDNMKIQERRLKEDEYPLIPSVGVRCIAKAIKVNMETGPWIAGGSVRKNYHGMEQGDSDWDFFFRDIEQFNAACSKLKNLNIPDIYTSEQAITFKYDNTVIQLIRNNFYNTPEDVLDYFDFSVAQYLTDGYTYILGDHTLSDHDNKRLRYLQPSIRKGIMSRILKYRVYGYYMDDEFSQRINSMLNQLEFSKDGLEYEF